MNFFSKEKLIRIFKALLEIDDIDVIKCVIESLLENLSE